jgi:hypothetical protein
MEQENNGSWFSDFLRYFDYFGVVFTFRYKDKDSYQSRFGGGVFIFFLIFSILYFLITFFDFCTRQVYQINYSVTVFDKAPEINFKDSSFYFAYGLQYDNDTFPDSSILNLINHKITLNRIINSNSENKNKTSINTKICEYKDFSGLVDDKSFKSLKLDKFLCPIIDNKASIQGTFADEIYQYLDIGITVKDEVFTHDKNVSLNLDYLSNFFSQNALKLVIYWIDTTVNVREYDKPISSYIKPFVTYVDFSSIKKVNLDFSLIQFSSDSNILVSSATSQSNVTFNQIQEFSITTNDRFKMGSLGKTILKLFFRSSSSNIIIDRNYQKLTEFLANLGGLQSNILIVLFLMVSFLNEFWAEQKVMNKILKFREFIKLTHPKQYDLLKSNLRSRQNNNSFHKSKSEVINHEPSIQVENITYLDFKEEINKSDELPSSIELKERNDSESKFDVNIESRERSLTQHHQNLRKREEKNMKKEEENVILKSKEPVSFNIFEIICRNCPCVSKKLDLKNKLYEKGSKKLEYYFDIFTYLKKMQEIDLIKYLLLDKNQIQLFNFISKPSVSMNYSDSDDIYKSYRENKLMTSRLKQDELESIIESYKLLKSRNDDVNNKLFYLFDYEIDHLLVG